MSRVELVALIAMMFSTIAFSIDSMLPALPQIAAELTPEAPNRAQLILTAFVGGMGIGTFFTGPLSDAYGRKPVILYGSAVYIGAAAVAWQAQSLEVLLAARFVQGLGAAAPRVVAQAVIRDIFSGREMARIMSFVLIIFGIVPVLAPTIGAGLIALAGWRAVFAAFMLFAVAFATWMALRLRETLDPDKRRPIRLPLLKEALAELVGLPSVVYATAVLTLCFGILFTTLSMVQPVYDITFGRADTFPYWFGVIAVLAGSASLLNAIFVMRLGMRRLITMALGLQIVLSTAMLTLTGLGMTGDAAFYVFVAWQLGVFFQIGLCIGNLNALALEPVGHIAGMAASMINALATVGAVVLAIPIGLAFDGTPLPLVIGVLVQALLAFGLMLGLRRIERRAATP